MKWFFKLKISTKLISSFVIVALISGTATGLIAKTVADQSPLSTVILIFIVGGVAMALSMILGILISRSISKSIRNTARLARALADGNLDEQIKIKNQDETGHLATIIDQDVRKAFMDIKQAGFVNDKLADYTTRHVNKVLVNLERLVKGDLNCDMTVDTPDDDTKVIEGFYITISNNLHATVNAIKSYIDEIATVLNKVADGNLNVSIESEFQGDFLELKESINGITDSLSSVLGDINTSAEQVAAGTRQVSDGSQQISQGATEQASSIEELSASITQMADQIKENAINASKTMELASDAKKAADIGNENMKEMLLSMDGINESSANISKIIKVIDDIAFQTNILALNAAVEAARAGTHGKGFAVVAEEVRNLAARSAKAAKETTDLIEGTIKKVEDGTLIASKTAQSFAGILEGATESVDLTSGIATASNEQASGIVQINLGIDQLSKVVQTNSATAQQSAATSEELSSQTEMLKSMIGSFQLRNGMSKQEPDRAEPEIGLPEPSKQTEPADQVSPTISLDDDDFGKY